MVFLDRDGVINEPPGAERYVCRWEAFRFQDGALEMLAELAALGYRLVVITNQQGIGKGLIDRGELERIHGNMCAEIGRRGAGIDGIFCCPHLETDGCGCRKPKPGLIFAALETLGLRSRPAALLVCRRFAERHSGGPGRGPANGAGGLVF